MGIDGQYLHGESLHRLAREKSRDWRNPDQPIVTIAPDLLFLGGVEAFEEKLDIYNIVELSVIFLTSDNGQKIVD